MTKVPRHLIVSSDVKTWKFDQPVLFLGKWCLREQDRHIWEKMDAAVARPVGAESEDKNLLFQEARGVELQIFPRLVKILNEFHGTEHDQRYWRIVLGHWFRTTVDILINRVHTLERAFEEYRISSTTAYNFSKSIFAGTHYSDALDKANNSYWNTELFIRIIGLLEIESIKIEKIWPNIKINLAEPNIDTENDTGKLRFYRICRLMASKCIRNRDAFIVSSYLPLEKEFLLNIALGQIPQWRLSKSANLSKEIDENLRLVLSQQLNITSENKIERIVSSLLFHLIPICYLEDFDNLNTQASELVKRPKNPRFIFTSNSFVSDEVFKVWTAKKVASGTPYFVGQHGNNYGTNKFLRQTIEEITSDKFLTWGWKQGLPQHTPAFIFKNISNSKIDNYSGERIILIENLFTARTQVWEQAHEFEEYMAEQFRFVSSLRSDIRKNLTVRLHAAYGDMLGEEDLRWRNFDKSINLNYGKDPIRNLWQESRLIVHSYDSTGLLETLEANVPSVAFWQNGLDHLVDDAIPYYELLVDAGILHLTPESAANRINGVWGDVANWWDSSEVQKARKIFCSQYARTSKKPIRDLKKILLENI